MPFRFLDHTADVQVECRAETWSALLETAAEAFYAVTLRERRDVCVITKTVAVTGAGGDEVLIRWLQELLFLLDTEHFVGARFEFDRAGDTEVVARVSGYACSREERAEEVKSATYHGLVVEAGEDGFLARFILDL